MKPILCEANKIIEYGERVFLPFMNCTLEEIDPKIIVSDYSALRYGGPINKRENTIEVMEVTGVANVSGNSVAEVNALSDFAQITDGKTVGKTVLKSYKDDEMMILVFTDNSYISVEAKHYKEYDESYTNLINCKLTFNDLISLELVDQETIDAVRAEKNLLSQFKGNAHRTQKLKSLRATANSLGFKLVESD